MEATSISIDDKIDELLAVLDTDIRHIQQNLSYLNELRSYVIKRDDASLSKLLELIRGRSDSYRSQELKRQSVREELADALGWSLEQVTLSALGSSLPKGKREQVTRKREQLSSLIQELKKEHLSTALLLSECARINRTLLKEIFNLGNSGTVYYGSNGAAKRQSDMAFVNLQL
jgi:hypothetical protein